MPKALFVTKDLRPVRLSIPIAEELKKLGWGIEVVAEGPSAAEWEKAGYSLLAKGPLDPAKEPAWFGDSYEIIRRSGASVVVTGLSSPINAEGKFGFHTYALAKLPWVALDDNWGAFTRAMPADLYLTTDGVGANAIRTYPDPIPAGHTIAKIHIMGDPATSGEVPPVTAEIMRELKSKHDFLLVLATQKCAESDDILDLVLHSAEISAVRGANIGIIPRIHPGAAAELKERWRTYIKAFKTRLPIYWLEERYPHLEINSDHLAWLAEATAAATAGGIRGAAAKRKTPVCVWTPRLGAWLREDMGLEHHPLVIAGAALELTRPIDLIAEIERRRGETVARQIEFFTPVPFNPKGAAEAIAGLV